MHFAHVNSLLILVCPFKSETPEAFFKHFTTLTMKVATFTLINCLHHEGFSVVLNGGLPILQNMRDFTFHYNENYL